MEGRKHRRAPAEEWQLVRRLVMAALVCVAIPALLGCFLYAPPSGSMAVENGLMPGRILAAVLALGCVLWLLIPLLVRRGHSVRWFLPFAALTFLLGVPEVALRMVNFSHQFGIKFGYPRPGFQKLLPDAKLFWRLRPGDTNFMNDQQTVNALGFPGPDLATPKPAGVFRIMYMGDSCTQQGYPFHVQAMLDAANAGGGPTIETAAFGVAGYSSYQGTVMAEMFGASTDPDLVIVYFGWNDHWSAYGEVDAAKVGGAYDAKGASLLGGLRIVQGLRWLAARGKSDRRLGEKRVPLETYRENLLSIKRSFEERRVPVLFVTAPTAMYRVGAPPYLVKYGFADSTDEIVRLHREYNDVVRAIAAPGGQLVDLEREFEAMPAPVELFKDDRIHFKGPGMTVVARSIADAIQRRGLIPSRAPSRREDPEVAPLPQPMQ